MAEKQVSTTRKDFKEPKSLDTHYIFVPRLGEVVFAVKSDRKLVNGRWEYEMARDPAGRTVSFVERLIHVDEFGSINYTYFGDGVVSNWDWVKDCRGSKKEVY